MIIFINRNGLPWHGAPREYGPPKSLYNLYKCWCDKGIKPYIPGRKSRGKPIKHDKRRNRHVLAMIRESVLTLGSCKARQLNAGTCARKNTFTLSCCSWTAQSILPSQ